MGDNGGVWLFLVLAALIAGGIIGHQGGKQSAYKEAVENKCGEYVVIDSFGRTEFRWKQAAK